MPRHPTRSVAGLLVRAVTSRASRSLVAAAILATTAATAQPPSSELRTLEALEQGLQERLYKVPIEVDLAALQQRAQQFSAASSIELTSPPSVVAEPEPITLDNGRPSGLERLRIELTANGSWDDLATFIGRLTRFGPPSAIDRLEVGFGRDGLTAELELAMPQTSGELELFREPQSIEQLITLIDDWTEGKPGHRAIAALTRTVNSLEGALALTSVKLEPPRLVLEGLAPDTEEVELITATLSASSELERIDQSSVGRCQKFSAHLELAETDGEVTTSWETAQLFDAGARRLCEPVERTVLPALRASGGTDDPDNLFDLDYQDLHLAGLFQVVGDLFGINFVVADGVEGEIDLTFERASLDQLTPQLETLPVIVDYDLVSLVLPEGREPAPLSSLSLPRESSTPLTVSVDDIEAAEFFCTLGTIFDGTVRLPAGFDSRVSVFALQAPLSDLLAGALRALGLEATLEGAVLSVRHSGTDSAVSADTVDACELRSALGGPLRQYFETTALAQVRVRDPAARRLQPRYRRSSCRLRLRARPSSLPADCGRPARRRPRLRDRLRLRAACVERQRINDFEPQRPLRSVEPTFWEHGLG